MKTPRINLLAAWAVAAAVSAGLAGCGGSSDNDDPMAGGGVSPVTDTGNLPEKANLSLTDGEGGQTLEKDAMQKFDDGSVVKCEGPGACALTFKRNPAGDYSVHSTGGTIEVTVGKGDVDIRLPDEHDIRGALRANSRTQSQYEEEITVDAGKYKDVGGVRFSCPPGGLSCTVTFSIDASPGASGVTAISEGHDNGVAVAARISTVTEAELKDLRNLVRSPPTGVPATAQNAALVARLNFPTDAGPAKAPDDDDDDDTASKFARASSGSAAEAAEPPSGDMAWKGGPWSGEAWTGDDQVLIRFSNMETAKVQTFGEAYGEKHGSSDDVTTGAGDLAATAPEARTAFWKHAKATLFPKVTGVKGSGSKIFYGSDDAKAIEGMFDGVPGTFKCASSECTVTVNAGSLGSNEEWTFTATSSGTAVPGGIEDEDYLAFGWWRDSDAVGGLSDFRPVYSGRMPFVADQTRMNSLKGKAVYEGGAAGNYTVGDDAEADGGWFTAKAKVTATFGSSDPGDTIKGEIWDFMGKHGKLGDWMLESTLGGTKTDPQQLANPRFKSTNGTVSDVTNLTPGDIGGKAGSKEWKSGHWGGTFYGDSGGPTANKLPSGVAGWFHARTDTGGNNDGVAIQGSFAAARQP